MLCSLAVHISLHMKSRDNGAQTTPDERNEDKTLGELKYRQIFVREIYLPIYCFCLCTSNVFPSNLKALPAGKIKWVMHI